MDATQGQGGALPQNEYQTPTGQPVYLPEDLPATGEGFIFVNSTAPLADDPNSTRSITRYLSEALLALALLALGFCFWEWNLLFSERSGVGTTLFFLSCIVASLIYLRVKGLRQNIKSMLALGIAVAGALPFVIYGSRDFNILIWLFEVCACLLWVAYSCRTIIVPKLSGFIAIDFLNQLLVVPLANCYRFFTSLFQWRPKKGNKHLSSLVIVVISIAVFIPLLVLICSLLAASDDGFAELLTSFNRIFARIDTATLQRWCLNLFLGIPVAAYIFGSIEGNSARRHTDIFKFDALKRSFLRAHRLKTFAFFVPLSILVVIYISYFIAMGSYLTSALAGELPQSYTYAQYARQGFFELCGVATINLIIVGVVYLLAKRQPGSYPLFLRVLTAALALLTIALVITAASKMLLYINTYGLSPLRLYTSVFMLLLLIIFALLLVWHIKPFNAARPSLVAAAVLFLALSLANTDGIIANYNVRQYLEGRTEQIDPEMLGRLSDATLPALRELQAEASDPTVQARAEQEINSLTHPNKQDSLYLHPTKRNPWYYWNLTSWNNNPWSRF